MLIMISQHYTLRVRGASVCNTLVKIRKTCRTWYISFGYEGKKLRIHNINDPKLHCQSYTEQYQRNRQDSRLLRRKSMGRKMACERKEGRGQSLSFIFLSQILVLLLVINNSILNI
jgi:hypothetical protein